MSTMRPRNACLALHLPLPAGHAVERRPGQLARRPLDVAQVAGERAELRVGRRALAAADGERRQPAGVERRRPSPRRAPCAARSTSGSMMSPATDRCASTASRAISRCMISVEPSKIRLIRRSRRICSTGDRALAAGGQRVGRLVAATAADLHQLVGDLPGHLARVQLDQRRLDADVVALVVGEHAAQVEHGLHAVRGRGDEGELRRHRLVLADRPSPLDALGRPLAGDVERTTWRRRRTIAGSESRPVLSVVSAIFRPRPSPPITFSAGTNTSWKRVTLFSRPRRPMNALRRSTVMPSAVALDDERGDAAAPPLGLGHPRHHHEQRGDRAVGGPQLDAVELVAALDRARRSCRGGPGRSRRRAR